MCKIKWFLAIILLGFLLQSKGQSRIYIFKDRYKEDIQSTLNRPEWEFENIKILLQYMMDPKNTGDVDYRLLDSYLDKIVPDKNSEELLCIDLENVAYENVTRNVIVKGQMVSRSVYQQSENKLIELIRHVKAKRPKMIVGIFGLPFRALDQKRVRVNSVGVLDPILSEVDVIFPSMYVPYERKEQALAFLRLNLDRSFEYADRLNKPVVPFFWYLLFPTDSRKLRHELIPRKDMLDYIKYVENYTSRSGRGISGIVWWDTPTQYSRKMIKQNLLNPNEQRPSWTMETQFQYYFGN